MPLRFLLRSWLRQKAAESVRQKVADTVRDAAEPVATPVCHVGLVFALAIESGGLEDRMPDALTVRGHGFTALRGHVARRNVVIVRSGSGTDAAARATEALIQGHRPRWVISAGFAGGLAPNVARHDVVMADSVVDTAGNRLAIDLKIDPAELAKTPGVYVGRLVTTDHVIRLASEKRELGQKHDAIAVDMETYAVADVCRRRQVRFLSVRAIHDALDDELPPDVDRLTKQKTTPARLGAALGAAWRRPASIKEMVQLRENALVATDGLAKFLESMVEQLVPM